MSNAFLSVKKKNKKKSERAPLKQNTLKTEKKKSNKKVKFAKRMDNEDQSQTQ